ncbi:MAG: hypothetical protein WA741_31470 [Candidatus Sulfotelmatobacter sp.]
MPAAESRLWRAFGEKLQSMDGRPFQTHLPKQETCLGFRIVCNNLRDARRARELLSRALKNAGFKISSADYVSSPRGGYRALHLWFGMPQVIDLLTNTVDILLTAIP